MAAAETVVPPGNGAATQYTEAIPTSGGNTVSGSGIKGGGGGHPTPSHVLGHRNATKLESKGQVGKEVAQVAAETAPSGTAATVHRGSSAHAAVGGGGTGGSQGGGGHGGRGQSLVQHTGGPAESGDGSSALGEVVGQATGSSSGESGLLLPLILLAALLGSAAYAWRRRPAH